MVSPRMANGNKAFRVYNPIRENMTDPTQLYRSFRWGSLAEFFLIDDRQYRSPKYTCCNNAGESGFVLTDDDTTCHVSGEALAPSAACNTAMADSSRTILGAAQKAWLESGLLNSTATFKFIMNGPPITQLIFVPYDRWEAWPAERNEILDFITTNGINNVIWLSTDLHGIVISPQRLEPSMSSTHHTPEIVAGAIGMDPIFRELPPSVSGLLPIIPNVLTQVSEFDLDRFNVVTINVDPGAPAVARFDFLDRTGATIHSVSFNAVS
jgi:alkaline phosphatase D